MIGTVPLSDRELLNCWVYFSVSRWNYSSDIPSTEVQQSRGSGTAPGQAPFQTRPLGMNTRLAIHLTGTSIDILQSTQVQETVTRHARHLA